MAIYYLHYHSIHTVIPQLTSNATQRLQVTVGDRVMALSEFCEKAGNSLRRVQQSIMVAECDPPLCLGDWIAQVCTGRSLRACERSFFDIRYCLLTCTICAQHSQSDLLRLKGGKGGGGGGGGRGGELVRVHVGVGMSYVHPLQTKESGESVCLQRLVKSVLL